MSALTPLANLIAPIACAGCHRPDVGLCSRCASLLEGHTAHPCPAVAMALWDVPIISAGAYRGIRRQVVAAFKDGARWRLGQQLITKALVNEVSGLVGPHRDVVVVPVPSSPTSFWRRGYVPTLVLATILGSRLGGTRVISALFPAIAGFGPWATIGTSRHRSRTTRLRRRGARIVVQGLPPHSKVVLVDDVMVTGGTLEACARALKATGHSVIAVVVVAHSPQKRE